MDILFDPPKNETNKRKHGYDFAALTMAFFESAVIVEAKGGRQLAVGWFTETPVTVVFRWLGTQGLSVVSMRTASRKERRLIR